MIAGEGSQRRLLEDEIAKRELTGRFVLLGNQNEIAPVLREFDIFVLSSRSEGLPMSLDGALAAGLPAIATKVGGIPDGRGRLRRILVSPESPAALYFRPWGNCCR